MSWSGPTPLPGPPLPRSPDSREFLRFMNSMSAIRPAGPPPPPPPPRAAGDVTASQLFEALDTNHDGVLDRAEFRAGLQGLVDTSGPATREFATSPTKPSTPAPREPSPAQSAVAVMRDIDERRRNLQADLAAVHRSLVAQDKPSLSPSEQQPPEDSPDQPTRHRSATVPQRGPAEPAQPSPSVASPSLQRASESLGAAEQLQQRYNELELELDKARAELSRSEDDKDMVVDMLKQALINLGTERDQLQSDLVQATADADHLRDVNQALVQQCQMYKLSAEKLEMGAKQQVPADIKSSLSTMQKALHTVTVQRDQLKQQLADAQTQQEHLRQQLATSFVQPVRAEQSSQIQALAAEVRELRRKLPSDPPTELGAGGSWRWVPHGSRSEEARPAQSPEELVIQNLRGGVSSREPPQDPDALFDAIDANNDGLIDPAEFAAAQSAGMLPADMSGQAAAPSAERLARSDGRQPQEELISEWSMSNRPPREPSDELRQRMSRERPARRPRRAPAKPAQQGGAARLRQPEPQEESEPCDPAGLAGWIMKKADRHNQNGVLSVNELRTYLPDHPFTAWLAEDRGRMLEYDQNRDGGISLAELREACSDFLGVGGGSEFSRPGLGGRVEARAKEYGMYDLEIEDEPVGPSDDIGGLGHPVEYVDEVGGLGQPVEYAEDGGPAQASQVNGLASSQSVRGGLPRDLQPVSLPMEPRLQASAVEQQARSIELQASEMELDVLASLNAYGATPESTGKPAASTAYRATPEPFAHGFDTDPAQEAQVGTEVDDPDALFDVIDTNHDDVIDPIEFAEAQRAGLLAEESALELARPQAGPAGPQVYSAANGQAVLAPTLKSNDTGEIIAQSSSPPLEQGRHRRAAGVITGTVLGLVNCSDGVVQIGQLLTVLEDTQYAPFSKWFRVRRDEFDIHGNDTITPGEIEDAVCRYLTESSSLLGAHMDQLQNDPERRKRARSVMRQLYRKYAKLTTVRGGTFDDISKESQRVDLVEFLRFLAEYDFIPTVMSRDQAKALFYQSKTGWEAEAEAQSSPSRRSGEHSGASEFEYCVEAFVSAAIEARGGDVSRVPTAIRALQQGISQARRASPARSGASATRRRGGQRSQPHSDSSPRRTRPQPQRGGARERSPRLMRGKPGRSPSGLSRVALSASPERSQPGRSSQSRPARQVPGGAAGSARLASKESDRLQQAEDLVLQSLRGAGPAQSLMEKSESLVMKNLRQGQSPPQGGRVLNVGELAGQSGDLFDAIDTNHDGVIDPMEFAAANSAGLLPGGSPDGPDGQTTSAEEIFGLYVTEGTRSMDVYSFTAFIESFDPSVTPHTAKTIFAQVILV